MADDTLTRHYQGSKTISFQTHTESRFSSLYSKDATDACQETTRSKTKGVSSYSSSINGESKRISEISVKEYTNGTETKSFIQQRVERLYGPGALAQGFFVSKRQRNRDSESEAEKSMIEINKSPTRISETPMKQSSSSPALPVLRHLRPEFRAQLPAISPRKNTEIPIHKSSTSPMLKDDATVDSTSKYVAVSEGSNSIIPTDSSEDSVEKNGHYFLKVLQNETNRLLKLADSVEDELEKSKDLPEEVVGKIRSASGKARLLVSQKMQQFKGLCTNNITQGDTEAFPTTNDDLQGFWDMVMLQVNQVDTLFGEISQLKANNWQEVSKDTTDAVLKNNINGKAKKVATRIKTPAPPNEEIRKKRELQRKQMIEERRRAMKSHVKPVQSIEIFVPESS